MEISRAQTRQEDKKLEKIRDRALQLFDNVGNISKRKMSCKIINKGFWKDIECHNGDWWEHWEVEKQKTYTYSQPRFSGVVLLAEAKIKHYEQTMELYEESIRVLKGILTELPQFEGLMMPKKEDMNEFQNLFQEISKSEEKQEVAELPELPDFADETAKPELEDFDETLLEGASK